jgi:hypothetical protein
MNTEHSSKMDKNDNRILKNVVIIFLLLIFFMMFLKVVFF